MGGLGEVERKSAPTRADIEDLHAVAQVELGGEVALLGGLGLFQRHALLLEIGTGILAVAVEEELIEAAVEIIMVLDIAPGAGLRIELAQPAAGEAEGLHAPRPAWPMGIIEI